MQLPPKSARTTLIIFYGYIFYLLLYILGRKCWSLLLFCNNELDWLRYDLYCTHILIKDFLYTHTNAPFKYTLQVFLSSSVSFSLVCAAVGSVMWSMRVSKTVTAVTGAVLTPRACCNLTLAVFPQAALTSLHTGPQLPCVCHRHYQHSAKVCARLYRVVSYNALML